MAESPLLAIRDLYVRLPEHGDRPFAVEGVSLDVGRDEIVCLVGESGSGKTLTGRAIVGLLPGPHVRAERGEVRFDGEDLLRVSRQRLRELRGNEISMVFQEPMTALNPLMTIGRQIDELIQVHTDLPAVERRERSLMIAISDNTATNILIDLAGMDRINDTMRSLGMVGSILGRPMVGRLAIEGEQENLATPDDYARAVGAIVGGSAASKEACRAMMVALERQQNHRRIGRHVPGESGYRWGSKTGTNTGIVNDVGYVAAPVGTMCIAVYCRGVESEVDGEEIIAEVARAAMRAAGVA